MDAVTFHLFEGYDLERIGIFFVFSGFVGGCFLLYGLVGDTIGGFFDGVVGGCLPLYALVVLASPGG